MDLLQIARQSIQGVSKSEIKSSGGTTHPRLAGNAIFRFFSKHSNRRAQRAVKTAPALLVGSSPSLQESHHCVGELGLRARLISTFDYLSFLSVVFISFGEQSKRR